MTSAKGCHHHGGNGDGTMLYRKRKARRWAWLKALAALVLFPVIGPIFFAFLCFRENEWPWEDMP